MRRCGSGRAAGLAQNLRGAEGRGRSARVLRGGCGARVHGKPADLERVVGARREGWRVRREGSFEGETEKMMCGVGSGDLEPALRQLGKSRGTAVEPLSHSYPPPPAPTSGPSKALCARIAPPFDC